MTVIVLTLCPAGLRGFLTLWLQEISPGVFVGNPSTRVRGLLWDEVRSYTGQGRALLAHTAPNEQGYTFDALDHHWEPVDHDGAVLIQRRKKRATQVKKGWSKASKRRRFGRR